MRIPLRFNQYKLTRKPTPSEKAQLILLFNSWIVYYLFEQIHSEFIIKSKGLTDSLGVKWKVLSESRRIYKPLQRGERTQFRVGRSKRSKKELLADRNPPINIDTHRLERALKPGRVIGGLYHPPNSDQVVRVNTKGISISINIPYADKVQSQRPYLPSNINPWLRIAIENATPHLVEGFYKYALL